MLLLKCKVLTVGGDQAQEWAVGWTLNEEEGQRRTHWKDVIWEKTWRRYGRRGKSTPEQSRNIPEHSKRAGESTHSMNEEHGEGQWFNVQWKLGKWQWKQIAEGWGQGAPGPQWVDPVHWTFSLKSSDATLG